MDDDLLITNTFISMPDWETKHYLTKEIKRQKIQETFDFEKETPIDQRKINPVIDDDYMLKNLHRGITSKEKRTIISVNSNQRNLTIETELDDPINYLDYIKDDTKFQEFSDLYLLAKNFNRNIQTYQQYISENDIPLITFNANQETRGIINMLLDRQIRLDTRQFPSDVTEINQDLWPLLNNTVQNINGRSDFESLANILNAFVMDADAFDPRNYWRPFFFTGVIDGSQPPIKQIVYKEQYPSHYSVVLPNIIKHVKSVRLISSEIPNTVNNITTRNNILTIQLKYKPANLQEYIDVPLNESAIFNFILVTLDIGNYTLDSLVKHMQTKINQACRDYTLKKYDNLFTVSYDISSGIIKIICNRHEIIFHLKFYTELSNLVDIYNPGNPQEILGKSQGLTKMFSRDLWYMLGFPWPYQISEDGSSKFTNILSNQVNFGKHPVFAQSHINNDIFDRTLSNLEETDSTIVNLIKPYKMPNIQINYIYLVIKGLKNIQHINQFNQLVTYTDNDIFAKVILNRASGQVCIDSYVDNPLVYVNAIDKIESMEFLWIDEQGYEVDFNNVDHSFTLEIIHYVTQNDVNQFNSTLGNIDQQSYPIWLSA